MESPNTKAVDQALIRVANTQANHLRFLHSPPHEKAVVLELISASLDHARLPWVKLDAHFNPFDFSLSIGGNISFYSVGTYTSMQSSPLTVIGNHVSLCKLKKIPNSSCFVVYSMFAPIVKPGFKILEAKDEFDLLKYMSDSYLQKTSLVTATALSALGRVVPSFPKTITAKLDSQWHFLVIKL